MKFFKSILLLFACLIISCEKIDTTEWPKPLLQDYDDVSYFKGEGDYRSVTYYYYCYEGNYISTTFTCTARCWSENNWERITYITEGICDND